MTKLFHSFILVVMGISFAAGMSLAAPRTFSNNIEKQQGVLREDFYLRNIRLIQEKAKAQLVAEEENARNHRRGSVATESQQNNLPSAEQKLLLPVSISEIQLEANYILSTQYLKPGDPADGAFNNVYGAPTWVVPRENGLAILGLIQAADLTGDATYLVAAQKAADYLVRIQDTDGGWYDQYSYDKPAVLSKSPTQTAEVMMALKKLGYSAARYTAMKKGAQFLMSLQSVANKRGADDGLVAGGKNADGTYSTWRWASDNSFSYLALKAAEAWAITKRDTAFSKKASQAATKVLNGINAHLYVSTVGDADYGVWRRVVDERDRPVEVGVRDWINYAPQMLDIPATGVGKAVVGEWIHTNLQKADGSVVWDNGTYSTRKSPGYSFQAALVWLDLGQTQYADAALNWARSSGLWQTTPDSNGISGSWIDWSQGATTASWWERFIDTSFYYIGASNGGYNFRS